MFGLQLGRTSRLLPEGVLLVFVAAALAAVDGWQAMALSRPVHLAFSHDEETGGEGARQVSVFDSDSLRLIVQMGMSIVLPSVTTWTRKTSLPSACG